jgi:hypothetical protein
MNFNQFVTRENVNYEREDFYNFMCVALKVEKQLPLMDFSSWSKWLEIFYNVQDDASRDLVDTQDDCLGVLF